MRSHVSSPVAQPAFTPRESPGPALLERLAAERILAVVVIDDPADAAPLAQALVEGGVRAIELAWRTPATLEALRAIVRTAPEMLVGIGTVLMPEQVRAVAQEGAQFALSPGLSRAVLAAAREAGLPFVPGVQTASDVQAAIEEGCRCLKYFPAETAGGLKHLRSLHAPFAHLGLRYIPLGGIDETTAREYLQEPSVLAVGGSWIATKALITQRDWAAIRTRAARTRELVTAATSRTA